MNRRTFLRSLATTAIAGAAAALPAFAALPKMKITRVRVYLPPNPNPLFNQSDMVVTVETDAGITGIGEGGSKDLLEQSAGRLIGQDPQYIERLWQDMNRAFFYPAGRETNRRHRRTRPRPLGHQGQGAQAARPPASRRHGPQLLRVLQHRRHHPRHHAPACASRSAPALPSRPAIAPSASAPWTCPPTPPTTPASASRTCAKSAPQAREGVGKDGDWVHRLPPALRSPRCHPRLQRDRGPRALLRRRPGAHRSLPAGPPHPPQQGQRSSRRRRRVGQSLGLQHRWSKITTSTSSAPLCPTSAASPR